MPIVLLSTDLLISSQVTGAAQRTDVSLQTVGASNEVLACCQATDVPILLIDLSHPQLDVTSLVKDVRSLGKSPTRIVAFGPHVHEQKLASARKCGCDEVVSRGEFCARIDEILTR